ncbi:hypothetical protein V7S43_002055 [Phytophthora oleae]|uniref:Polycystin domain-containing protein n=1 Tax=Phytophthora oleae TaxID=2107226 RepID=A0ABD3G100_9STRA
MVKQNQVSSHEYASQRRMAKVETCISRFLTADRKLIAAWAFAGLIPYVLMLRTYVNFVTPHKITENLVVQPGAIKEMTNLAEACPLEGFELGQVWWNAQITHYYNTKQGPLCHFVVPQYNIHGNILVGKSKTEAYDTTPSSCQEDSYPVAMYLYHGSFGYFSFYQEQVGTYCALDDTAYVVSHGLGTYDMNGPVLVEDTGSTDYRQSYWYGITGLIWVIYRGLVLRRSYILCKRYGRRCSAVGVKLRRKEAVVFVHEQLRLTAHDTTLIHRVALLYLLVEGLMGDLFLIVANNGFLAKIQYVSLGYNLSGLLLLAFEIIESTKWLKERTRVFVKRLLFCYEASLLGEIVGAALQQQFLTLLNGSRALKRSNSVNLTVSHYVWSIAGHCIFVFSVIGFIIFVRALWAVIYVWWQHRTWSIFSALCSIDTVLGKRTKMTMLGGYRWHEDDLYYKPSALKAFGLLKTEENGTEYLVLRKLHWLTVPRSDLFIIGTIARESVRPCSERPCMGLASFWDRRLGGHRDAGDGHGALFHARIKVAPGPEVMNVLPSS